jgi:hypothetical protein
MTAFTYPAERHLRRHGPQGYADAEIVGLAAREDPELHRKLMGFPGDLPNVARLRPPGGNGRPEGIEQSYFVRKQKEILPQTY